MKKKLLSLSIFSLTLGGLFGCSSSDNSYAFIRGEGEPTISIGKNGDTYLDENSFDLYKRENDSWIKVGNIKGEDHSQVENGLSAYELYCKYHPAYKGSEEEWINALSSGELAASYKTKYNIIFTLATIPPVLSALDSVRNGNETYAFIERGKTYNGINQIKNWHNIGFNTNSNSSSGFTVDDYNLVKSTIQDLNVYGNEHFSIYVQDGTALYGANLASNAQLNNNQFDIIMVEDGTGAYNSFKNEVIGKRVCNSSKDEIYQNYKDQVDLVSKEVETIFSSKDSQFTSYYSIEKAFYLSALDNFHYWFQDKSQIEDILNKTVIDGTYTKLFDVMGIDNGHEKEVKGYKANLKFESISSGVASLEESQKENYLRLMYGSYYEDTYKALTRTTLDDSTPVSAHKLIYIGTRFMSFPTFASDPNYGIGGVSNVSEIPSSYAALNNKYKTPFLFENESDYNLFLNTIENNENYDKAPTQEEKDLVKVASFNQYINYMFALKYAKKMYGDDYDLIIKGHPSEVMGSHSNWSRHYEVATSNQNKFNYDKLIDQLMLNFHSSDSTGKFIGSVPYGTAAENLAYLGADISICGLPSSTYTGYDTSVPVVYVMSQSNGNISSDGNLASRYEKGSLTYTSLNGKETMTSFINIGNVYKNLASYYKKIGNVTLEDTYNKLFSNWLITNFEEVNSSNVSSYSINEQGFLIC